MTPQTQQALNRFLAGLQEVRSDPKASLQLLNALFAELPPDVRTLVTQQLNLRQDDIKFAVDPSSINPTSARFWAEASDILRKSPGSKLEAWRSFAKQAQAHAPKDVTRAAFVGWFQARAAASGFQLTADELTEMEIDVERAYAALEWGRYTCPHFVLTPDFVTSMALTEFGVGRQAPRLPFPTVLLSVPPMALLNNVTHLFVSQSIESSVQGPLVTTTVTAYDAADNIAISKIPPMKLHPQTEEEGFAACIRRLPVPMQTERTQLAGNKGLWRDGILQDLFTVVANFCEYLVANSPLPTEKRKHGAEPKPVEKLHNTRNLFEVGRTIKLDPGLRQAMLASGSDKKKWKLAQRFVVRGHKKPNLSARLGREVWVDPYWKGPKDVNEALARNYVVQDIKKHESIFDDAVQVARKNGLSDNEEES